MCWEVAVGGGARWQWAGARVCPRQCLLHWSAPSSQKPGCFFSLTPMLSHQIPKWTRSMAPSLLPRHHCLWFPSCFLSRLVKEPPNRFPWLWDHSFQIFLLNTFKIPMIISPFLKCLLGAPNYLSSEHTWEPPGYFSQNLHCLALPITECISIFWAQGLNTHSLKKDSGESVVSSLKNHHPGRWRFSSFGTTLKDLNELTWVSLPHQRFLSFHLGIQRYCLF